MPRRPSTRARAAGCSARWSSRPTTSSEPLREAVAMLVRRRGRRGDRLRRLFFALRTLEHQRGARAGVVGASRPAAPWSSPTTPSRPRRRSAAAVRGVSPQRFAEQLDGLAPRRLDLRRPRRRSCARCGARNASRAKAPTRHLRRRVRRPPNRWPAGPRGARRPGGRLRRRRPVGGVNANGRAGAGEAASRCSTPRGCEPSRERGIEVGSHCMTRRGCRGSADELEREMRSSADALEGLGLPRSRALAYPMASGRRGRLRIARRLRGGIRDRPGPGIAEPFALPRIEVWTRDTARPCG